MIKKYLVDKLTASPLLVIDMSFASMHGIETLILHESSLELSVEETHTVKLSEEIEHHALDELNILTPLKTGKIKEALHSQAESKADSGTGPKTINDQIPKANSASSYGTFFSIHGQKDDILNVSSSHIVDSSYFDGNILITPIFISCTFKENAIFDDSGLTPEHVDWIDFSRHQGRWNPNKNFSFIISIKNIFHPCPDCLKTAYINSSNATHEYGLIKHSNVFQGEVQLNLTMNSCISAGTAFTDNILVHDEASLSDTLLIAGILKGSACPALMQYEWNCNCKKSKGYVPAYGNIQELNETSNISNLIMCKLEHTSLSEKHYYVIKRALNDSVYAFKHHVNSSHEYLDSEWLLKEARGIGFAGTFNAFCIDDTSAEIVFMEFLNSIVKDNSYLQKPFKYCTNMNKHEEGLSVVSSIDLNQYSFLGNSAGTVDCNYSIFERSIVGSVEHTGDNDSFADQSTPEDNKVVPQNDTILEISIIESSNVNGLLMQT